VTDVATRYSTVADHFLSHLRSCAKDRWTAASPCPDWTARDVARHVVENHRRLLASLAGTDPVPVEEGEDLVEAFRQATEEVRESLVDAERATQKIKGFGGREAPFEELVAGIITADTLVHTWDFARACGEDERLDPDAAQRAYEFLVPLGEAMRGTGRFGPAIDAPPDADVQTRLLAFSGRSV
jgi:uncharacterized protein (TIGR03086 family)